MIAALETLGEIRTTGKRIAVLADMLELGPQSEEQHRRVGEWVTRAQVDCLLTYGDQAKLIHDTARAAFAVHYDQKNVLAEYLAELLTPGDVVLVKGSRGMKMEDVEIFLQQRRKE
jgi:UDP-N-acetylmuramoyl-tripeptide--D-alanyl-D-alanine ligase